MFLNGSPVLVSWLLSVCSMQRGTHTNFYFQSVSVFASQWIVMRENVIKSVTLPSHHKWLRQKVRERTCDSVHVCNEHLKEEEGRGERKTLFKIMKSLSSQIMALESHVRSAKTTDLSWIRMSWIKLKKLTEMIQEAIKANGIWTGLHAGWLDVQTTPPTHGWKECFLMLHHCYFRQTEFGGGVKTGTQLIKMKEAMEERVELGCHHVERKIRKIKFTIGQN